MKREPTDAHPCGCCLRWPECNGVEWPNCAMTEILAEAEKDGIKIDPNGLALLRLGLDMAATLEDRRKRERIL